MTAWLTYFILKIKQMAFLVYIIGDIQDWKTIKCQKKFEKAQIFLETKGYAVFNPMINIVDKKMKFDDANRINFIKLINCNVVYVLNSVSFINAELLLAIKLNMLIIQDSVYLNEDEIDNEYNVLQD
jgi:hypothetical protein